jgi:hypothetical protein
MRVAWTVLPGLVAMSLGLPGCGPAVSKSELGNVVFTVPDVPGANQPYLLPDINAPPGATNSKLLPPPPKEPPHSPPVGAAS